MMYYVSCHQVSIKREHKLRLINSIIRTWRLINNIDVGKIKDEKQYSSRVRGSGSVWKRRSEIFQKIRKRIRVGSKTDTKRKNFNLPSSPPNHVYSVSHNWTTVHRTLPSKPCLVKENKTAFIMPNEREKDFSKRWLE
ncbi:hypothetical protein YC2023_005220 [Brassica napus]